MARERATQDVNTVLIDLYWKVGEIISHKIEAAEWGDGVVDRLAQFIARTEPGLRGFTRRNLFRMRQFYEAYRNDSKVSPLVTQMYPEALSVFRDAYTVKFLGLPRIHAETDLHRGLLEKLRTFSSSSGVTSALSVRISTAGWRPRLRARFAVLSPGADEPRGG